MREGIFQQAGSFTKLIFSVFIIISCFFIAMIAGLAVAVPIFKMGFLEIIRTLSDPGHPDYIDLLKFFQVVQSFGLFIVPPFILGWFFSGNSFRYLMLNKKTGWQNSVLTVLVVASAIPLINYTAHLNTQISLPDFMSSIEEWMIQMEDTAQELIEKFVKADNLNALFLNILIIAVIPAIGEELLFRGVIQRLFTEWTKSAHAGIWISAVIFSAMHLQFYGFIPRTLLGVLFGYMLVWSGSIWIPVLAHFVNNAAAVTVYYFIQRNRIDENIESIGTNPGEWIYLLLSLMFLLFFLGMFFLRSGKRSAAV